MFGLNFTFHVGNITNPPSFYQSPDGEKRVCRLTLACNKRIFRDGDVQNFTDFVDYEFHGALAEKISRIAEVGHTVIATGRQTLRTWTTKSGVNRSKYINVGTWALIANPVTEIDDA